MSSFTAAYKRYVLCVLTAVYTLNFIDRNLMFLLLQPIKEDLQLSDTQLGFLTGIAFGLFYAVLGLPIARWADRGNRATITSIAIGLWGITVMSCMFVANFVQMMLARVAAAAGEAGCMPPTYSLLGDYFSKPTERIRSMAIYWLGAPLSALISLIVGGWLNERYGWRMTFLIMGLPALAMALIVKLTVTEPRTLAAPEQTVKPIAPSMIRVLATLWQQRSTRHLGIAIVLHFAMSAGLAPWYAAFMMRSHGMGTADLGIWLGLIFGTSGIIGILAGGYVATRWFGDDERAQLRMSAILNALLVPCFWVFLLLPGKEQALLALLPLGLVFVFVNGPTFALMQRLVSNDMRATAMAVVMMLANLIGMGVGPQIVGILSDRLRPALGDDSLRYAMLSMSFVALWAAYHFWRAGRTVKEDLRNVQQPESACEAITSHA
jgi:MFS family permease